MHKPADDPLIAQMDKWSNWLLAIVVFIPFIVSFGALKDLAAENGVNYPFMYPLMIDLSLIIFNLIALRSSLHGERNLYSWALVLIATVISVVLNTVHAPRGLLPMFMAALPPLFILAAFHLVVMRIEQTVKRNQMVMTLEKLAEQVEQTKAEHAELIHQREMLTREVNTGNEQLQAVREQLQQTHHDLQRLQREQSQLIYEQSAKLPVEPSLDELIATRREQLLVMLNNPATQMTQGEMAEALGVSISTIRRDLQSLNGQVKR